MSDDGMIDITDEAVEALRSATGPRSIDLPSSPLMRIRRKFHRDPDGVHGVHTQQDVQGILDLTKHMAGEMDGQSIPENNYGIHAAQIPITVLFDIYQGAQTEEEREERLVDWLNDPDNRLFRTWKGRVTKGRRQ